MYQRFVMFTIWYVLVLCTVVIGIIREDSRFYFLGGVNAFALVMFWLAESFLEKKDSAEIPNDTENTTPQQNNETAEKPHHSHYVNVNKYVNLPLKRARKTFFSTAKFYIPLLILALGGLTYSFIKSNGIEGIKNIFSRNQTKEFDIPDSELTGKGQILGSGLIEEVSTGTIINSGTSEIFVATGEELGSSIDVSVQESGDMQSGQNTIIDGLGINDKKSLTMMDAIVYLLETNAVSPSTKKDIAFTYVSTKNPYYGYWRTAYQKRIIGKDTNPSKLVLCETFFTLKGMIENRNINYTANTVKSAFRAEAKKRDILNGCIFGKVIKGENL